MFARRLTFATLVAALAVATLLGVASATFAYSGDVHKIITQRAVDVMQVFDHMEAVNGEDDFYPFRRDADVRYFPQLTNPTTLMSTWLVDTAWGYDGIVGDFGTRNHFWDCDDDLDECPEGWVTLDNAWETARSAWLQAIISYQGGNVPMAYYHLGAVMHLVEDMAQPAHTNSDLHYTTSDADRYNKDSLEEWGSENRADNMYSWTIAGRTSPGRAFNPPSKLEIIQRVVDRTAWEGRDEFFADSLLIDPNDPFNTAQLFYILYVTNQWANYFASDGESGNKRVRLGWVDYEALGFPKHLHRYGAEISPQSEDALDDNEGECDHPNAAYDFCNYDGDLRTIASWGYKAATKGSAGVLNLFRRTIDGVNPITTVVKTRDDGQPFAADDWNASPVTVRLSGATDPTSIFPASGVWTVHLCVDNKSAVEGYAYPITSMEKRFDKSGDRRVQVRTTDNAGNTEINDFDVKVDVTKPLIMFPGWRSWYRECESVTAKWSVVEPHSGVKHSLGLISAQPVLRNKPIPRYLLIPGSRTLSVTAEDNVGNKGFRQLTFAIRGHDGLAIGKPSVVRVGTSNLYKISGTLAPQHYKGTTPITLLIWKRPVAESAMARMVKAKVLDDGRYSAFVTMKEGKWRVVATHRYPTMESAARDFRVQ